VDNGHAKPERPLRAVLDTNVMISGLFGQGTLTATIYTLWVSRAFTLVTSREILREVADVLHLPDIHRRFQPRPQTITRFFRLVFRKAILTQDLYVTDRLTADPTDNKFLAAALEGQADYIVSRDPHLLNLKHFHTTQIVEPPAFVRAVRQRQRNRE
jgi:putative PIN family toxin of toxin-antitoxin system